VSVGFGVARGAADRDEQRAIPVLVEVMVRGVDLEAAEGRDERARVHRIGVDERAWREPPGVQPAEQADAEREQKAGQLEQHRQRAIELRWPIGANGPEFLRERVAQLRERLVLGEFTL
jgi:hypothetical protein